jgi:hypothetical protein
MVQLVDLLLGLLIRDPSNSAANYLLNIFDGIYVELSVSLLPVLLGRRAQRLELLGNVSNSCSPHCQQASLRG